MLKRIIASILFLILTAVSVLPAWATGEKSTAPSVRIAVIDTGIAVSRLDSSKVLEGKNYITGGSTTDLVGHGTRIASIILGADDGKVKLEGSAPEALLVPLVYSTKLPSGVPIAGGAEMIAECIRDAVDVYDCKIICVSSGVIENNTALEEAVIYADKMGTVVIAAVGNDNIRATERIFYPAAYETVISVGSVDSDMRISDFSQLST